MEFRASTALNTAGKWSPSSDVSGIVKGIHAMLHPRNIVLVGLSNLMADAGSRIASIDVNPFLINTKTGVAVDGLIVLNNAEVESTAGH
jgi:hypothetical protein